MLAEASGAAPLEAAGELRHGPLSTTEMWQLGRGLLGDTLGGGGAPALPRQALFVESSVVSLGGDRRGAP